MCNLLWPHGWNVTCAHICNTFAHVCICAGEDVIYAHLCIDWHMYTYAIQVAYMYIYANFSYKKNCFAYMNICVKQSVAYMFTFTVSIVHICIHAIV